MHHRRRLLTISHSYVVALNRRLAHELARAQGDRWEVTAAAPAFFHGDLRSIPLERGRDEASALLPLSAHLTRRAHVFFYGPELYSVARRGWDLVHAWEEPFVLAGAQVAHSTPRDVPLVFATYQNLAKRYLPPFRQFEDYVLRRASGWIAGGVTIARVHDARPGYRTLPVETIPLGVDVEDFRPAPEAGARVREALGWSAEGPPVVGYLGRFVAEKGVPMLQRALERCAAPWRALFVGGGALEAELRAWGARHGDRVRVVTGVPHDRVPAHLNAMDLLCAPSQTTPVWIEQLGRMLVEAFACGVPVVGSDSGEIPFTVGDGGLVLGERDEAAWRATLETLLESPARRRELGAQGLARAHTTFAWSVVARRTLGFFDRVLDGRAR